MRARYILTTLLAIVFTVCCAMPEPRQGVTTEADVEAVESALDEWAKAVNAGDAEGLLNLVSDDLEMIPPGLQPVTGAKAHEFLRGFTEQFTAQLTPFTNEEIVVSGDWAFHRYSYELTLTPKEGGESITERGHGIHMFRRQSDGSWKVAKDIWTSLPPPSDET